MKLRRSTQRMMAAALAVLSGTMVLLTAGSLTAEALDAQKRLPTEKAVVDELSSQGRGDPAVAFQLHAEYERQTEATLERETAANTLASMLIVVAALFIIGCKWFISLRSTLPPLPKSILALLAEREALSAETRRQGSCETCTCDAKEPELDLSHVDEIVGRIGRDTNATIPILHAIQAEYNYLPEEALARVAELTRIPAARLIGVASFYSQFRTSPRGEHLIKVCTGTACHVAGAPRLTDELRRHLQLALGQDTDAAREFTVEEVACLGCCTLAPVVQVDDRTYGHLRGDSVGDIIAEARDPNGNGELVSQRRVSQEIGAQSVGEIRIGLGSCCVANGSRLVHDALREGLAESGIQARIKRVGCVGMCHQTPLVEIRLSGKPAAFYAKVGPEHAKAIVRKHFRGNGTVRRLGVGIAHAFRTLWDGALERETESRGFKLSDQPVVAFLDRQKHIATEHCGSIDPTDLDEYLRNDGFTALRQCIKELDPMTVIERVRESGLSGRGGAGFPTGTKWATVQRATGDTKYVICNGDEGDPGAFMDRMLMESYPYRIIEGLAIAAYAVGSNEGFFYIRNEYPLAVERIREAIQRCEERGYLGDRCFDTDRTLHLRIMEGAGAFVCGEETALIASIEGKRGMPSLRPPYPAESGLWGKPTLVNNAETYASVPWLLRNGSDAFARLGTETSKGTKVFSLAGKIRRGGLIEVPMGITIREIVEDIGGGIKDGRAFKAVQIGGPSGGCVPERLADTRVDYQALQAVGAIMGSGGLVVLDDTDCMVDIARYFLAFTQGQSCGQCTQCRVGTRRMLEILERLCEGHGKPDDLDKLEHLAHNVKRGSLCGLGKTAPNPVLTTLDYFRDEYGAHLEGRCPAGQCKALIRYEVTDDCTGCTLCAQHCPVGAIPMTPYERHEINLDECTKCDVCRVTCPEDAVIIVSGETCRV